MIRQNNEISGFHPVPIVLMFLLAPSLWVLFVSSVKAGELVVGAISCLYTILFSSFVYRSSSSQLAFAWRDLAQAWRIPGYTLSGIWEILLVLARDLAGGKPAQNLHRVCGFDTSKHDPVRAARSVVAIAYTTVAPNFIVIGIDASQSRMLFHQISRTPVPTITRALGARA